MAVTTKKSTKKSDVQPKAAPSRAPKNPVPAVPDVRPSSSLPPTNGQAGEAVRPKNALPTRIIVLPADRPNPTSTPQVQAAVKELRRLQRHRVIVMKSRIMQENRLRMILAIDLGYDPSKKDAEDNVKKMKEADKIIRAVISGKETHPMEGIILNSRKGIEGFLELQRDYEKRMVKFAKELPVMKWVEKEAQNGFGLLSLATIVGECGDLNNYERPGQMWARMGCAPYTSQEKTLMGATWRSGKEGKLTALEWEDFGYSPRRRSISYLIGENLVRGNYLGKGTTSETETNDTESDGKGDETESAIDTNVDNAGPYRARYLTAKAKAQRTHPEWPKGRCHLHGMLLATKAIYKRLWVEWTGKVDEPTTYAPHKSKRKSDV